MNRNQQTKQKKMNKIISNKFEKEATHAKYLRVNVDVKWFNSVLGRTLIFGKVNFKSFNNFRTNKDLQKYVDNYSNKNENIFIIIQHCSDEVIFDKYKNLNFFPRKAKTDILNANLFCYAKNAKNIKFKRNKPVNIKINNARIGDCVYDKILINTLTKFD